MNARISLTATGAVGGGGVGPPPPPSATKGYVNLPGGTCRASS
jgi:hypothetical protein